MKAFITKYALTEGILEVEGVAINETDLVVTKGDRQGFLLKKGNWEPSRESAVFSGEKMRLKELSSLKKQIAKLEGMKFE